jgi:hypothetical protein
MFINAAGREFVKLKENAFACLSCGYIYTRKEAQEHGEPGSTYSCPTKQASTGSINGKIPINIGRSAA